MQQCLVDEWVVPFHDPPPPLVAVVVEVVCEWQHPVVVRITMVEGVVVDIMVDHVQRLWHRSYHHLRHHFTIQLYPTMVVVSGRFRTRVDRVYSMYYSWGALVFSSYPQYPIRSAVQHNHRWVSGMIVVIAIITCLV